MEPTRNAVVLDTTSVSYLEWLPQRRDGRDVLLLHGGGLDNASLSFGDLGPALARAGHRVLAPDHPGYGQSPRDPGVETQQDLVGYVGAFAAAVGLSDYAVGGLSLGGGLALGHVLSCPEAVTAVVLLGSYGLMPRLYRGPFAAALHWLTFVALRTGALDAVARWYTSDRERLERSLRPIIRDPRQRTPELVSAVAEAARGSAAVAFSGWQRSEVQATRLRTCYLDRLATITAPTMIIHGDRDTGVPIAAARLAAASIPRAELLTIPGAGHWVQRDQPSVVHPALISFLAHA